MNGAAGIYTVTFTITGIKGTDSEIKTDYITALEITNIETSTSVNELKIYPNPARRSCTITTSMKESGNMKIIVYNSQGQVVKIPYNGYMSADEDDFEMDISDLSNGLYFISLSTDSFYTLQKLLIIE